MASIQTQDWVTLVRNQVSAIQGYAKLLVDLTVGSVLRAVVEANAALVIWLQGLLMQVLSITRASTSSGADLDSWVADFGVTRLAAVAATGTVTFSRFTTTQQVVVPTTAVAQTADGTQQFNVVIDTTNAAYNAALGGYVIAAGVASVSVPVKAVTAGAAGNAVAGSVSTIVGAISGIDTVTNAAAFTNGVDAESDTALRMRFIAYVASLSSKATKAGIGYAITSLQQGLVYSLTENQTYGGATQNGYFFVVVDDGTGNPPSTLLSSVANAIDAARPFTSSFGVFAPVVVNASVAMTATIASGYDPVATKALVVTALKSYINALQLGWTLPYSRLTQVAYDASPGVINITGVTLNGGAADLAATNLQVIKWSSVTVA
ncbi:baseplate protein [Ralstonia pseudosolanacearum]|uniref:baseplate J/gp47 family protein n=1 Tax=Ralstonia solanacearum species complex TaxID=3116862 RepID=UPI0020046C03|nr:baseplate J/gp47 family protein [Ralstonia pseudosolanacearum]MCK4121412.1 baseplate protein [Ralstonia pseudosolanacearum]